VQKELVGFAVESFGKIALHIGIAIVGNFDAYFLDYCGLYVFVMQGEGRRWRYGTEKESEGQGE
jgi:hypothetical protein